MVIALFIASVSAAVALLSRASPLGNFFSKSLNGCKVFAQSAEISVTTLQGVSLGTAFEPGLAATGAGAVLVSVELDLLMPLAVSRGLAIVLPSVLFDEQPVKASTMVVAIVIDIIDLFILVIVTTI